MKSVRLAGAEYALSPLQEGILFDSVNGGQPGMYFEQAVFSLRGPLDAACLRRAWQLIADRHDVLRTRFVWEGRERPCQEVMADAGICWRELEWHAVSAANRQAALDAWLREDRVAGFVLSEAPPLRLTLIAVEPEHHYLVLSSHHLLLDRWSIGIVVNEVVAAYDAFRAAAAPILPAARPYRDYIAWLRQQDAEAATAFWRDMLDGLDEPTSIARLCDSAAQGAGASAADEDVVCSASVTTALRATARSRRLTLNTVVQGAWTLVLSRYACSTDVVYGVVMSGRPPALTGATSMVGLFINTLPIRVRLSPGESILSMLQRLQRLQVRLTEFEYSSLVDIKTASRVSSSAPLFDTLYVFQNLPVPTGWRSRGGGLRIDNSAGSDETTYPLVLLVVPGDRLLFRLRYDPSRVPRSLIQRMAANLETVLTTFSRDVDAPLGSVPLVTDAERARTVASWNDTTAAPVSTCVHQLVAEQARRNPAATAVVCGDESLTYRALDDKANELASYLRSRGVGAETRIAVLMPRTLDLMVALLGVLKAGAAYVPIDPAAPGSRSATIIRNSAAAFVVVSELTRGSVSDLACERIDLSAGVPSHARTPDDVPPIVSLEQAAYVMYTSGSTGRPKGVVVPHGALSNYIAWCVRTYPVAEGRGALVGSSIAFDLTITGLFAPLVAGGEVWLVADDRGPEGLASVLRLVADFSLIKLTPAHLDILAADVGRHAAGATRALVVGGEALRSAPLEFWRRAAPTTAIFNEYGPTETAVGCSVYRVSEADAAVQSDVPIGRPIANTELYVLDGQLQLAPVGVPGELYVGGCGVTRGYLNEPAATAASFIADPFAARPGRRLYRTGDLARYREDGELEFLGRLDDQVKIRGYRVELGEITTLLRRHPAVGDAIAVLHEPSPGDRLIVAYATPKVESVLETDLRVFLQESLPEYMVPSKIIWLRQLPLTPNGKVDRRGLPPPGGTAPRAYAAPRSAAEEKLAAIWTDVLKVERVGIDENFFELGGHSLRIFQLAARVQAVFGVKLPMRAFFDAPTVAQQIVAIALKQAELTGDDALRAALTGDGQPRGTQLA